MNVDERYNNFRHFYEPQPFISNTLIISDGMGHESSATFCIDRDFFCNYVFMYVLTGTLHVIQYSKHYLLSMGQGILMNLQDKHKYYSDNHLHTEILWFHFRGNPCDSLMLALYNSGKMPFIFANDSAVDNIYECFDIMSKKEPYYEFSLSIMLYKLLIQWTAPDLQSTLITEIQGNSISLASIHRYIEANINRNITLSELADYVHMSKYHFCRVFSKQFHITPAQYILRLKVNISKRYLVYTSDSLQIISQELGFIDQSHYSKVFKQQTGLTPSKYRHTSTSI